MLNWLVIGILVLVVMIVIKLGGLRHGFFIILLLFVVLFFYGTLSFLSNERGVDFSTFRGWIDAAGVYVGWFANGFQNLKTITGNVINMDWTSTNGSFFDKENSEVIKNKK
ncbi:hypothetical protein GF386_03895 [Candidatus Pacearchaeota archaeon]|nr:hypothetical protein [Candidatus Pacearchaeota archaeon]MBD3283290.1 hypothetical protein [Candidatus Pacearchaeota archaeon]